MRGSPLRRACLIILALVLVGLPVWRITSVQPETQPTATKKLPLSPTPLRLLVTFAHPPQSWTLRHLGKVIAENQTSPHLEITSLLEFPAEGIDLQLKVAWPKSTPETAVKIEVIQPDGTSLQGTLWGLGTLDDVITLH
jgi:hypothetical protein